ncbi:MAG: TetR/AcrR family transcriptional regulator [Crocinitomicaceae bacterium]
MAYLQQNPLSFEAKDTSSKISPRQIEIIVSAGKLLTKNGSSGLTIKNLAKAMNFSEAALYRHFISKEEIIVSCLDYLTCELDNHFSQLDKILPASDRFTNYFNCLLSYFHQNPHLLTVGFSDGLFELTEPINEASANFNSMLQKHLIPIIMDGKLDSTFPMEVHSEKIVHIVIATIRLHLSKWRISNFSSDVQRSGIDLAQTLLALFGK